MPRQDKVFVCFQKAEDDTHKLYIYDDVTAYGTFNWSTWSYEESETSAKYFQEQLAAIPDTATIELHINSNGGSVKEGVAIYSQLKQKNCKKVGYVDGVAYSVAFLILQLLLDVRRQGHLAQPLQHLQKDALIFEPHQPVAVRQLLHDLCRQLSVAEGHPCALPQLLSRTHKALPHVVAPVDKQQNFAGAAAGLPMPQQTRRQHPGIVQDQAVAGVQILR